MKLPFTMVNAATMAFEKFIGEVKKGTTEELAIAILEAVFDWQPIETAPKDPMLFGDCNPVAILVTNGKICQLVQWSDYCNCWTVAHDGAVLHFKPTHWLAIDIPLPEVKDAEL